jgi:nucleotide-binding universal stress UspA family protein
VYRRILVAYDGSEGARAALHQAVELSKRLGAELSSVSVEEHLPHYAASLSEVKGAKEEIDAYFHRLTKEARDYAALHDVDLEVVIRQGHEVEEIVTVAREGAFDLLVIGYHGHSVIFERVMGSTAQSIVRLAPCAVLLAK